MVFCKLQHLVLVTLADCTSVSAGFGQGGNFCVNVQTLTIEMCIIYPAFSHITFFRLISNRSMQRASPHLEFLKMFCYCIIQHFFFEYPCEQMVLAVRLVGQSGFFSV